MGIPISRLFSLIITASFLLNQRASFITFLLKKHYINPAKHDRAVLSGSGIT